MFYKQLCHNPTIQLLPALTYDLNHCLFTQTNGSRMLQTWERCSKKILPEAIRKPSRTSLDSLAFVHKQFALPPAPSDHCMEQVWHKVPYYPDYIDKGQS